MQINDMIRYDTFIDSSVPEDRSWAHNDDDDHDDVNNYFGKTSEKW